MKRTEMISRIAAGARAPAVIVQKINADEMKKSYPYVMIGTMKKGSFREAL